MFKYRRLPKGSPVAVPTEVSKSTETVLLEQIHDWLQKGPLDDYDRRVYFHSEIGKLLKNDQPSNIVRNKR